MTVTNKQFANYLRLQKSGVTNMFDVRAVQMYTGLTKDQIIYIMTNYAQLKTNYNCDQPESEAI